MTESLLLGLAGGASGLLFTVWIVPVLAKVARAPGSIDLTPDIRVYLFLGATSVLAGLGAGLVPARHAMRDAFASPLKGSSAQTGASPRSLSSRSVLVGVQAAASLVLLVVAALMTRGMVRAAQVDVGFDAKQLLTVAPAFGRGTYDAAGANAYWDLALERVRALPGVQSATACRRPAIRERRQGHRVSAHRLHHLSQRHARGLLCDAWIARGAGPDVYGGGGRRTRAGRRHQRDSGARLLCRRGSHRSVTRADRRGLPRDHHRRRLERDYGAAARPGLGDRLSADARHVGGEDGRSQHGFTRIADSVDPSARFTLSIRAPGWPSPS